MTPAASPAMNPVVPGQELPEREYQQLLHDIFHDLSQPLSTLTCLLEVNLLVSRPAKRTRHDLQIALKQIHAVTRLMSGLRELVEAGDRQQDHPLLNLGDCLAEVVADLLPVAENRGVKLVLVGGTGTSCGQCLVRLQASRLRQGVLRLLEFALDSGAAGGEIEITAAADGDVGRVVVAIPTVSMAEVEAEARAKNPVLAGGPSLKQRALKRRLAWAIARRIFEGAGGSLQVQNDAPGLRLEVRLPRVSRPQSG